MVRTKKKGIGAERELVHMFWQSGWAAIRSAGSGNMKLPSPDVLASNSKVSLAIECKSVDKPYKSFPYEEIEQLLTFSNYFGAKAFVAVKITRKGWFFVETRYLKKNKKAFALNPEVLEKYALSFDELIEKFNH